MADSYRLQVLKALTTHLQGITGAGWDGFNLSSSVFRGRALFGTEAPETMVSLLEAPRNDNPMTGGYNREAKSEEWNLMLMGTTVDDSANPTDPVYALVDVVEKRLGEIIATKPRTGTPTYPAVYMLGGLITGLSFGPPIVRPATEGISNKAFFYMPLRVGLVTVVG